MTRRRDLFRMTAALAAGPVAARAAVSSGPNLAVQKVERTWINLPFRDVPARNMIRELPHWTVFEICKVTLACGVVGFGETMVYYTWGQVTDAAVKRATGHNAAELMWDDSLGCGLQMALFDAVGKANDVPIHRLLGSLHRQRPFVSWWAIDMPAEDWALECQEAQAQGYTAFKTKARPWFDLDQQCSVLERNLAPYFKLEFDFNAMLLDTAHAGPYLTRIEKHPHVAMYESPIPQGDVAGNKSLRSRTRVPIALHYGAPPIMTALKEDVCDAFVIGGGASRVMNDGAVAGAADKPFFLQLVGTGITAAFALHCAAVLEHASLPAVNCHQLYTHALIHPAIRIENGAAQLPDAPGLGVSLDEAAVARFRINPLDHEPYPAPNLLIAIRWASGATSYYAHARQYWDDFERGLLPVFQDGVDLRQIPDNGSREWRDLQQRARQGGVHVSGRPL